MKNTVTQLLQALHEQTRQRGGSPSCGDIEDALHAVRHAAQSWADMRALIAAMPRELLTPDVQACAMELDLVMALMERPGHVYAAWAPLNGSPASFAPAGERNPRLGEHSQSTGQVCIAVGSFSHVRQACAQYTRAVRASLSQVNTHHERTVRSTIDATVRAAQHVG